MRIKSAKRSDFDKESTPKATPVDFGSCAKQRVLEPNGVLNRAGLISAMPSREISDRESGLTSQLFDGLNQLADSAICDSPTGSG
jgi:hypothetical protein